MNTISKQIIRHFIPVTILLLAIYSVVPYLKPEVPMATILNNTTLWWFISAVILIGYFLSKKHFFDKKNEDNMIMIWLYLLWNAVCIVRGLFVAEMYWDWKVLIANAMVLLMPIVIFSTTNKMVVQSLLAFYVKYALPFFLLFGLITRTDAFGFYLIPVSLLILFLPVLTKRQKYIVIIFTLILFIADPAARSNVVKFGVPFIILLIYYFRNKLPVNIFKISRIAFFVIPILFFVLGVTGAFNIFNIREYVKSEEITAVGMDNEGNRVDMNIVEDTRTFLYEEVLQSAINNRYWLLGRTPARGNDSEAFGEIGAELTGRYERIENEIGLANVFTWTGVVGVFFYFLIFYRASYLAVNKSRNNYVKMIGVYVAFRWLFAWVEDVNNFSLNYFMLMLMLGICFSYSFRDMTDREITIWARGIFDIRYLRLQQYLLKKEYNEKRKYSGLADLPQQKS